MFRFPSDDTPGSPWSGGLTRTARPPVVWLICSGHSPSLLWTAAILAIYQRLQPYSITCQGSMYDGRHAKRSDSKERMIAAARRLFANTAAYTLGTPTYLERSSTEEKKTRPAVGRSTSTSPAARRNFGARSPAARGDHNRAHHRARPPILSLAPGDN